MIALKMASATLEVGSAAAGLVEETQRNVERAISELRDLVHGILPRSLTHGGLSVGLDSLVADLTLPVALRVTTPRLPTGVETTAYFVVAEALTNSVKHARAREAGVTVELARDTLVIEVRDDGVGGADPAHGTGLTGLSDRVAAVAGSMAIFSPTEGGTTIHVELPVDLGDDRQPAQPTSAKDRSAND